MKVTTKFYIIALILSLILTASAVAAAEDISFDQSDSKTVLQETNMKLDQSQDNIDEKLSASETDNDLNSPKEGKNQLLSGPNTVTGENFTDIQTAINSTQAGETIFLDGKTYKGSSQIIVDKQLTITGASSTNENLIATLDAQELSRILYVTASNVVIKNINFINGKYNSGGAIYWMGENGTIENSNFTNNQATNGYGGAVYFDWDSTVTNCNFTGNEATLDGGAIWMYGGKVENCNFTDNTAGDWGGAIRMSSGTVTNCNFTGNEAKYEGGAIWMYGGKVENCNFTGNSASWDGGAIYFNSNGNVTNCNFTDNKATGEDSCGGAVYFNKNSEGIITNCSFTNNSATKNGGAVYFGEGSTGRTINCNFTNNTASNHGGAVYFYNQGTVTNCNFTGNQATGTDSLGGAIYMYSGTVTNCNFTGNKAEYYGGAIRMASGNVTNCNFTNNQASSQGGAIRFSGTGTVTNCNFTNNQATNGYGGAVYFIETGTVTNCNFTGNEAYYGGAIRMDSGSVTNCNFTGNEATLEGGAVFFLNQGTVTNCNFTGNKANLEGGAIYFNSNGNVTNCNFVNNSASGTGGAIDMGSGTVTNCNFTDNKADYDGGAIYFLNQGTVTNCNFTGNNATTGSAIYFYSTSATKTVSNSCFLNNRANAQELQVTINKDNITITFTGGNNLLNAIYSRNDAEVTFTNVTYWGATGKETINTTTKPSRSNKAAGQKITIGVVVNDKIQLNTVNTTDENGSIVLNIVAGDNYYITARHNTDSYYTGIENTTSNMTYYVNVTPQTTNNLTVNITAKSNIFSEVMPGKLLFILPNGTEINATYAGNGIWWAEHTFNDAGDYNITASYIGLDNVVINNATISIRYDAHVNVENKTLELLVGAAFNIDATTTPNGLNVTYVSDDSGVYSIDENGLVNALKEGTGYILVKVGGDGKYAENTTRINITVSKNPTEITVLNDTLVLNVTNNITAGATLNPSEAGNLTYTSNDTSVAVVKDGIIIAVGEGTAVITVSFKGSEVYAPAENKTITVTVKLIATNIIVVNDTVNLFVKESVDSGATLNPSEAGNLTYTSNDTSVVVVKDGKIFAVGMGAAVITVSFTGNNVYMATESKNITVNVFKYESKVTILPIADVFYPNNITIRYGIENMTNMTVSIPGISNDKIIITNDTITVISPNAGNYTITIINNENELYHASNASGSFNVNKTSVDVVTDGGSKTFDAGDDLEFTLKDSNGNPVSGVNTIISINGVDYTCPTDEKGIAKLPIHLRPKTYTATMTFAGNENYDKMNSTVQVTVKKTTPKIVAKKKTFKAKTKTKKYKITLKNNHNTPISKVKVILKIKGKKYKAKTNSKGKATFKIKKLTRKGKYKAKVTFKGNAFYNKVSKKVKITIK